MDLTERLAKERRARLAAERLLDQKSRELFAANEKLALHARALSDQIVEQRQVVKSALSETESLKSETESLKGQNARFLHDLERAHTAAVMAERRLWDSINSIDDGFAVFDPALKLVAANAAFRAAFDVDDLPPGTDYGAILHEAAENGLIDIGEKDSAEWCAEMLARLDHDEAEPVVLELSTGVWVRLVDQRSRDGDLVVLALDITEQMRIWAAIEAIPDGFVLFDREDRLMTCNQRYRDLYPESAPAMMPGASYEAILRFGVENGQYPEAVGREEDWIEERLERRLAKSDDYEQEMKGGRWLRVIDQETPDGGRVGLGQPS